MATEEAKSGNREDEHLAKISALGKSIKRSEERLAKDRTALAAAIVDATDDGVQQVKVVKAVDRYTRERVRQIEAAERERRAEEAAKG